MSVSGAARPPAVMWAYRLWVAGAGALAVTGVLLILLGAAPVRDVGVVYVLVAIAEGVLISRVSPRDIRWRSALAVLTLVVTLLSMFVAVAVARGAVLPLLASLFSLSGSLLAYRPPSEAWFTGGQE